MTDPDGRLGRRTLLALGAGAALTPLPTNAQAQAATRPRTGGPDWPGLAAGLTGRLLRPGSAEYESARLPRNLLYAPAARPEAIAHCAGTADVAECVRFARRYGIRFAVRSGGHCYAGWSSDTPLVLDLAGLDHVQVEGDQAELGPGAPLMRVYAELARHGVTIPAGTCPTVGLAGLALGGGHGVTSRAYGLTCDSIVGAEVVLADGRVVRCDAEREPELFWALRGAGNGNFGVVTSLRVRTHPAADCTIFQYSWDWPDAGRALDQWQRWAFTAPDRLWSDFHVWSRPDGASVDAGGVLLGDADELRALVAPLLAATGRTTSEQVTTRPFLASMLAYAGCDDVNSCLREGSQAFAAGSHFFDGFLSGAALDDLFGFAEQRSRVEGVLSFVALGGAVNRVPADATAFVHRGSVLLAQYFAGWPADRDPDPGTRWVADAHRTMAPHSGGHAYQNYRDPHLADWRTAYYGANLPRLERAKAAYDPDRVFDFPQAL
ncbi:FAD-binding oxidoreductase [Kitasatospora sp. NPDC002040]|uniref:FAD-binding oxidoreductase n=1 Tax=Kitasatospora sp. NPDC002040 TaxID=3154661 RepID=UPI00332BCB0B